MGDEDDATGSDPAVSPADHKKRRRWVWIAVGVVVAVFTVPFVVDFARVAWMAGQTTTTGSTTPTTTPPTLGAPQRQSPKPQQAVTYAVSGRGTAAVTYRRGSGPKRVTVDLPWTVTVTGSDVPKQPDMSAFLTAQSGGSAKCTITKDGVEIASSNTETRYMGRISC